MATVQGKMPGVEARAGKFPGPSLIPALTAIQRLAGAAGHSLAIPPPRTAERPSRTEDTIALVAFVIGAALIVLAWAASLRARPPKRPRRLGATPS